MSFILDALKRAEQERNRESRPVDIPLPPTPPEADPPSGRTGKLLPRSLVAGGLALLLGSLLLGVLLLGERSVPDESPVSQQPAAVTEMTEPEIQKQEPVTPEPEATLQPISVRDDRRPAEAVIDPQIALLYTGADHPLAADVRQLYTQPAPAVEEPPQPDSPQQPNPQPNPQSQPDPPPQLDPPPAGPSAEDTPTVAPQPAPAEVLPAPFIRELPWSVQQRVPSINYIAHGHRDGGDSHVVLNNRELRVGASLTPDLTLEAILPDGIVLNFQGHRFKLPAQSSWVNM